MGLLMVFLPFSKSFNSALLNNLILIVSPVSSSVFSKPYSVINMHFFKNIILILAMENIRIILTCICILLAFLTWLRCWQPWLAEMNFRLLHHHGRSKSLWYVEFSRHLFLQLLDDVENCRSQTHLNAFLIYFNPECSSRSLTSFTEFFEVKNCESRASFSDWSIIGFSCLSIGLGSVQIGSDFIIST